MSVIATEIDWQNDAVALLDLEDGTGACQNGTPEALRPRSWRCHRRGIPWPALHHWRAIST